jgi:predicted RNA-binding Zn ribbon-like protein
MEGANMHFGDYSDPVTTLAEDLVNSYSYATNSELLNAVSLGRMAAARGWSGAEPSPADVDAARVLRPRLRGVFETPDETRAAQLANELVAEAALAPQLVRHDAAPWHVHLARPAAALPQWLAGTAGYALLSVIGRGDADRLRRCAGPDCHAVFVDLSRNRARRFCSPALCGNRVHVAAHRARRAAPPG